ncbi:MAG: DNA primase, partial [Clostridium sp.]|nr:DNA primase [Clostridium sp.]
MGFPEELKKLNRWVGYRLVPDKDGGKPKKVPINAVTGQNAKSNDPSTWCDYQTAKDAADQYGYNGIGFMFVKEDGYVGVDVDHCYDPETNTFNEIATAIMGRQPTYMEFSPSGDGIHLWFKGTKPKGASKNTDTGVEMYDSVRYFTVTDKPIPGCMETVAEALPDTLTWIHDNYLKKKQKAKKKTKKKAGEKLTDEEIIEKATEAGNGEAFADLMAGKWEGKYPSQSEADMALCMKLAFWSGKDKEQMDRIFRTSGLFREKWDQKHHADGATYGEETIDRAVENTDSVYSTGNDSPIFEYEGRYFRVKGDNVYPITNFILQPVEMIAAEEETQMTADLVTSRGETYRQTFMTTDFANQQKFKNLLNAKTIALSWFGSDGDLELFKTFISDMEWTVKTGVKAMGIYEHIGRPVFASAAGSIEKGGVEVEDLVQLEKYVSIKSEILQTEVIGSEKLKDLGTFIMGYNEPEKTISILAWTAGCFIKPHLRKEGIKFPHLFLIGEAGSGKSTTLERVVLPVFSSNRVTAATQVTQFTLMKESASSNLIPMPLDEFKPSKIDKLKINALYNHFRDSYDGHEGLRGRADQSVVTYDLLAPLVVAGEESADEAAIREHSIELLFSKKDLKKIEYRDAFQRVAANEKLLQDFGRTILDMALTIRAGEVAKWHKEGVAKFSKELPSRVINNLACCYAGLKLLESLCARMGFSFSD